MPCQIRGTVICPYVQTTKEILPKENRLNFAFL